LLSTEAEEKFSTHDLNGNKSCVKTRLGFGLCKAAEERSELLRHVVGKFVYTSCRLALALGS